MGKPFVGVHIPAGTGHFQPFCSTKRRKCPHGFESNVSKIGDNEGKMAKVGSDMGHGRKRSQNRVKIGRNGAVNGAKWGQNTSKWGQDGSKRLIIGNGRLRMLYFHDDIFHLDPF